MSHIRAEYQKQYQSKHRNQIKETKRNSANAIRRLDALLKIKEALKIPNSILKNVKPIKKCP